MTTLPNFPFKNQLSEPIIDHLADQNARENCLPTCIAAGLQYFTGKEYTGSEVEHQVYGSNYHGGTSAVEYVEYVQSQGVALSSENGSPAYLVGRVHYHLQAGRPVIATIPSCYCPPQDRLDPGSSHCIIFYKDSSGVLIAMNPWQAISQANTDQWWVERFCYDQIWIMQAPKKGTTPVASPVPDKWKDDGTTLRAPNGFELQHGFRQFVLAHSWHPEDYPLENEHDGQVLFISQRLRFEPARGVWMEQLGEALKVAEDKNATLEKELAALKADPAPVVSPAVPADPTIAKELTTVADSIQNIIDSLSK